MRLMKLTLNDIVIKSAGEQLKEKITDKFGTLKAFADFLGITDRDLRRKLNSKQVELFNSSIVKFKLRLTNIFEASYDELVLTDEKQAIRFVDNLFENIHGYKNEEDMLIIKKLKDLCYSYNLTRELVKIKRIEAIYYYYNDSFNRATDTLRKAIDEATDKSYKNLEIFFICDLAMLYYFKKDNITADQILKTINIAEAEDNELKKRVCYKYYYNCATLKLSMTYYEEAINYYKKALQYSRDDIDQGVVLSGIGLVYKKKGEYDKALTYYDEALKIQSDNNTLIITYNNRAELFRCIGDLENAQVEIRKAIKIIEANNINTMHSVIVYKTGFEIEIAKGQVTKTIDKVVEWHYNIEKHHIFKEYVIEGLEIIITELEKHQSFLDLKKVGILINDLIMKAQTSNETNYLSDLEKYLGKIVTIFFKNKIEWRY